MKYLQLIHRESSFEILLVNSLLYFGLPSEKIMNHNCQKMESPIQLIATAPTQYFYTETYSCSTSYLLSNSMYSCHTYSNGIFIGEVGSPNSPLNINIDHGLCRLIIILVIAKPYSLFENQ